MKFCLKFRYKNRGVRGIKGERGEEGEGGGGTRPPNEKRENCELIVTFTDILEKNTSE